VQHTACALLVALVTVTSTAAVGQTERRTFKGHLVDTVCAVGHAHEVGYAEKHENSCNLMAGCIKSGYSLITSDRKALKFDAKGAELSLALAKATKKEKDLKVTVVGTLNGDTIAVTSLELD
jgi:hypothetical protein